MEQLLLQPTHLEVQEKDLARQVPLQLVSAWIVARHCLQGLKA